MHDYPPFPGFRDKAFRFLRDLKTNNARDWFKPRKAVYDDEILWPMRCLVADAGQHARRRGLPLAGDPKAGLFRIYRDTRFSKNKAPYKTAAGAVLSRSGRRNDPGSVYIHVEPDASFLGAGFWRPDTPTLRAWRLRMAQAPTTFLGMLRALDKAGLALDNDSHALKRMPRGFEDHAGTDVADFLRWKTFVATRSFPDEALMTPTFTEEVIRFSEDVLPLLRFGWEVLGAVPAEG